MPFPGTRKDDLIVPERLNHGTAEVDHSGEIHALRGPPIISRPLDLTRSEALPQHNGWSLTGLEAALRAQHKTSEANSVAAEAKRTLSGADVTLSPTQH
jgi:hypothetical protein